MKTIKLHPLILIIFFILNIHPCFSQSTNQKSNSAPDTGELNLLFNMVLNGIENHHRVENKTIEYVTLRVEPNEIQWQSEIIETVMIITSESRDLMKQVYQNDLGSLFKEHLKDNGWVVENKATDHWGEYEYRVMYGAEKEEKEFYFIYTATNLRNGDWDGKIYILSDSESHYGSIECDYDSFFAEVIEYLENRTKNIDEINNCLIVNFYENPIDYKLDGKRFKIRISFYCQFGPSSTPNGYSCFDLLPSYFKSFLEKRGYSVTFKEDSSETGWIKHLWSAEKKKSSFHYVYESESSMTSGYSKIRIIEK